MISTLYNYKPKGQAAEAPKPTLNKQSYQSSVVRDLGEELKRPRSTPAPEAETAQNTRTERDTPTTEASNEPTQAEGSKATANLDEGVKQFKEKLQSDIDKAIADPKRASKNVLKVINMVRFFLYPWLYKRAIFDGPQLTALEPMLKKVAAAKMENKEPELNNFEKEIYTKYQFYEQHKQGILWTPDEIEQINEVAYLKLAEVSFLRWLMVNEWALVIVYIESKRVVPPIAQRMGFGNLDFNVM